MGVDESFREAGSVPFKWEIRPGVPKVQHRHPQRPSTIPPPKLRPPPSSPRSHFPPPPDFRTGSFRSAPRSRSDRWLFDRPEVVSVGCFRAPLMGRNDDKKKRIVKLPEPMLNLDVGILSRRSVSVRRTRSPFMASPVSSYSSYESSPQPVKDSDPMLNLDVGILSRRSFSVRRTRSPFMASPVLSYSSYESSPQPVKDSDWAGFGLF